MNISTFKHKFRSFTFHFFLKIIITKIHFAHLHYTWWLTMMAMIYHESSFITNGQLFFLENYYVQRHHKTQRGLGFGYNFFFCAKIGMSWIKKHSANRRTNVKLKSPYVMQTTKKSLCDPYDKSLSLKA